MRAKRLSQALWPRGGGHGLELEGFELHHGRSTVIEEERDDRPEPLTTDPDLGWWQGSGERGGVVAGTYLHGVFDNGPWRRRWLNQLRVRRSLPPLSEHQPHQRRHREFLLDQLADSFETHVNLDPLLR